LAKHNITIAFYNVENLFDTIDNPFTHDDDFTTEGKRRWNKKRYFKKLGKLARTISKIGKDESYFLPAIVGLVEVENKRVLDDLIAQKFLKGYYDYVHYDSSDERGIDTALLYQPDFFELISSESHPLMLFDDDGSRDYTRDILEVHGKLFGEKIYFLVNHWPSRRKGQELSEPERLKASELLVEIMNSIKKKDKKAKFVIMGDFNDNPNNKSITNVVSEGLYNPMDALFDKGLGTLTHKKEWHLFDQIILSKEFKKDTKKLSFKKAKIYSKESLKVFRGKLKGSPFRTFIGPWYKGGVSDHFPVYTIFKKRD
tara:strand:+ start:85355 stop:86293 length:939 start_codon:yes stop_codon:yes gene_type:complete